MSIRKPLSYLFCCAVMIGCARRSATPMHDSALLGLDSHENALLRLDNHGGFSHAGRRITLRRDGSYADISYTDAVVDERVTSGVFTLNAEKTRLTLSPEHGESQHLYRVAYGGQQYWVREEEQGRVTQTSEAWLRQISLRSVP